MSDNRIPLAAFANRCLGSHTDLRFAAALRFAPLNDTEYHLTAHQMPLAIRFENGAPVLGVVLAPGFLAAPQTDANGRWRLPYQPIALRTWPFVLSDSLSERPLDGIDVLPGSTRIALQGAPICADPGAGALGPEMTAIRNTLLMLRQGGQRLSAALELLRIANVLVPLREADGTPSDLLSADAARLAALEPMALAALARETFLPLDLAGAIVFSRRHLDPKCLPLLDAQSFETAETPATRADPMDFVLAGLAAMNFALDGSDLFDPLDPSVDWGEFAPPPPAELPEEVAA